MKQSSKTHWRAYFSLLAYLNNMLFRRTEHWSLFPAKLLLRSLLQVLWRLKQMDLRETLPCLPSLKVSSLKIKESSSQDFLSSSTLWLLYLRRSWPETRAPVCQDIIVWPGLLMKLIPVTSATNFSDPIWWTRSPRGGYSQADPKGQGRDAKIVTHRLLLF